jgi:hypothetical protein
MVDQKVNGTDLDYSRVAKCIPDIMNALYSEEAFKSTSLEEIRDAFRVKQLQGKVWLLDQLKQYSNRDSKILVIGSWLGFTSWCLYKEGYKFITETDPDSRLEKLAKHVNRFNKDFIHLSFDVNSIDVSNYDVIINTSCEHISNNEWFDRIPSGRLLLLHSIDLPSWDHTNLCKDLQEMSSKYPMDLLYSGTLNLGTYNRFMLVGRKF